MSLKGELVRKSLGGGGTFIIFKIKNLRFIIHYLYVFANHQILQPLYRELIGSENTLIKISAVTNVMCASPKILTIKFFLYSRRRGWVLDPVLQAAVPSIPCVFLW